MYLKEFMSVEVMMPAVEVVVTPLGHTQTVAREPVSSLADIVVLVFTTSVCVCTRVHVACVHVCLCVCVLVVLHQCGKHCFLDLCLPHLNISPLHVPLMLGWQR